MKRVLAIIAMSLAFVVILVSGFDLLQECNSKYSNEIFEKQHRDCDIETTVNEKCYVYADIYSAYEIEPGESIHVYECTADGRVLGEYVSKEGESDYVTHSNITVSKTDSEELRQLVKSMNQDVENLSKQIIVIRAAIKVGLLLLFVGVLWVSWRHLIRSQVQESSKPNTVKPGIIKKVLAYIVLSLGVFAILFASGWSFLYDYEIQVSQKIDYYYNHQKCDIKTTVNEKCSIPTGDSTSLEIEPGESIHINSFWANGEVFGEYVSEEGEIYYVGHSNITSSKTNSEELKQLVKSMNNNIENLKQQRIVIRRINIGVHSLLFVGSLFVIWRRFRHHHESK